VDRTSTRPSLKTEGDEQGRRKTPARAARHSGRALGDKQVTTAAKKRPPGAAGGTLAAQHPARGEVLEQAGRIVAAAEEA